MVDFEWTVKLGDLLTVFGAAYVGSTILYKRGGDETRSSLTLTGLTEEIGSMKDQLAELAQVITTLAVQDNKIANLSAQYTMLQQNVEDLRRGTGYVKGRTAIDGEY